MYKIIFFKCFDYNDKEYHLSTHEYKHKPTEHNIMYLFNALGYERINCDSILAKITDEKELTVYNAMRIYQRDRKCY